MLSFNVQRLTGIASENRTRSIVGAIMAADDLDAICLQEVFDEDARAVLVSGLSGRYPFQIPQSGGVGWRDDSGLFFASRHPLVGQTFVPFDFPAPTTGFDFLVTKGVLGVSLRPSPEEGLLVLNTHLDAELPTTRRRQLGQIRQLLDSAVGALDPGRRTAVLLGGDLNVDGGSDEHGAMINLLGRPRDLAAELGAPALTEPADAPTHRLDYWLSWNELGGVEATLAVVEADRIDTDPFGAPNLSDHRPVWFEGRAFEPEKP
jgi:endonuclease/exonuclease/phosphatase family metal-dependent hydrolase